MSARDCELCGSEDDVRNYLAHDGTRADVCAHCHLTLTSTGDLYRPTALELVDVVLEQRRVNGVPEAPRLLTEGGDG